jgi:hypothetical protein
MAVDRWFFGMQRLAGYQSSVMHYTTAAKDTYLIGYEIAYDNAAGLQAIIHGVASDSIRRPSDIVANGHAIVIDGVGNGVVRNHDINIRIDAASRMAISVLPGTTSSTLRVSFTTVELPPAGKARTREQVMAEANSENTRTFTGYEVVASAVNHFLEYMVNGKLIQQPATQPVPAVADELFVVSTSASDTGAGAGAQKIKFKYLDASAVEHESAEITLTGTTPVDLIGSYADVYIITEVWVTAAGANGRNIGDILFQDTAA